MSSRVVLVQAEPKIARRERAGARDGWRVFHSAKTGFEIAIPAYQVARVEAIARRERSEWYALAVGELLRDEHGVHAVVRDFVPNDWAERGRAHVHLGAAAEAQVRDLSRELHPTLHSLGNLHTHQHFTTRPSGTDRQEFWSDPNSVSIIVDPFDRPTIAVYRGREGELLVEVGHGPVPDPPKPAAPVALPSRPASLRATEPAPTRSERMFSDRFEGAALLGVLAFAVFVGSFAVAAYFAQARRVDEALVASKELRERLAVLEAQAFLTSIVEVEPADHDAILECVAPEP